MNAKYAFIHGEEGSYSIRNMCTWAQVSRSGYHAWRDRAPSATARWRQGLAELITFVFDDSDGTYGYRRVHAMLARSGYHCDTSVVRSIMREQGLVAAQPRRRGPRTTVRDSSIATTPDLLGRDFTATAPATKLVGDITYIRTWAGWVYLATVLDCYSKKVIGYAMDQHMRTDLVTDALAMAIRHGRTTPGVTIFHSDRGTQYTSSEFVAFTDSHGITRSLGRTGICYDNAWAESFNATLKNELVHRKVYPTRQHAIEDITRWIELRYNHKRIHSAIGYRTPNEAENDWYTNQATA